MTSRRPIFAFLLSLALLSGCASDPTPSSTGGIEVPLSPTSDPATLAYKAPDLDLSKYHALLIEQADVYPGKDEDFDGASVADRQRLAGIITSEFSRVLGAEYSLASQPGPGVVRLHLTLAGLDETVPVISTALRLLPFGMIMTGVRSAEGKPAKLTGSVTIAGIAREADTGKILGAMVSRCSPPAYDVGTGMTLLGASTKGITRGAEQFRDLLKRMSLAPGVK